MENLLNEADHLPNAVGMVTGPPKVDGGKTGPELGGIEKKRVDEIQLVTGLDDEVAQWIELHIPGTHVLQPCTTIAIVDGDKIIAAVAYNNHQDGMLEASIAAVDPRWCNRRVLRAIIADPFVQLRVRRLYAIAAKSNKSTRRFLLRLGFKYEGTGRLLWSETQDACVYSMLRGEAARWIKETPDGQEK